MSYTVRIAEARDTPRILDLVSELRPVVDPVERHEWIYRANPAGEAITFLAIQDSTGETAGMASLFPWRMNVAGRPALAGLGGDNYVRPVHRRRGLAATMHAACRMVLEGKRIAFVFGTPTGANATPLASAGTRDVTRVHRLVAPAALLTARRPSWRLGSAPGVSPAEALDPRIDEVWDAACADHERIGSVRDAAFFDWRFRRAPGGKQEAVVVSEAGKPFAACALERRGDRLRIVSLVAADGDLVRVFRALLAHARLDALELRATAETARRLRLWSHGFFARDSAPLNVMLPHGTPPEYAALLHDGSRWAFSWSDTDTESTWGIDRGEADAGKPEPVFGAVAVSPRNEMG